MQPPNSVAASKLLRTGNSAKAFKIAPRQAASGTLQRLREDIRQTADAVRQYQLHAGYETVREQPTGISQKLKDLLVRVVMAGSGHQPGSVPNAALQQAWACEAKLSTLHNRYVPLIQADYAGQINTRMHRLEQQLAQARGAQAALASSTPIGALRAGSPWLDSRMKDEQAKQWLHGLARSSAGIDDVKASIRGVLAGEARIVGQARAVDMQVLELCKAQSAPLRPTACITAVGALLNVVAPLGERGATRVIDRLVERLQMQLEQCQGQRDQALFGLALNTERALTQASMPFMSLLSLDTYHTAVNAAGEVFNAADALRGLSNARCYEPGHTLSTVLEHTDTLMGEPFRHFVAQATHVLGQIDQALRLPAASAVELEQVRVLLRDMVAGAEPTPDDAQAWTDTVYRDTVEPLDASTTAQDFMHQLSSLAGLLSGWLLSNGGAMTRQVGNVIERHPLPALSALGIYGALSTFYLNWCLPHSAQPAGIAPTEDDTGVPPTTNAREHLQDEVQAALGSACPGHFNETIFDVLEETLESMELDVPRQRRSADASPGEPLQQVRKALDRLDQPSGQTLGALIRQAGHLPLAVAPAELVQTVAHALHDRERRQVIALQGYERILSGNFSAVADQTFKARQTLHAPILQPTAFITQAIAEGIKDYEQKTSRKTGLNPDSPIVVVYRTNVPINPNLQYFSPVPKKTTFTLTQIVTGTYLHDIRAIKAPLGLKYQPVSREHQPLIDHLAGLNLQARMESALATYQADPLKTAGLKTLYDSEIMHRILEYLDKAPDGYAAFRAVGDFFRGKVPASEVKFHGATLNGVFLVPLKEGGVLFSVDDNQHFFVGTASSEYRKFGSRRTEQVPVFPNTPQFKRWVMAKLPVYEQQRHTDQADAFKLKKRAYQSMSSIGIPTSGGQVYAKPFAFESVKPGESLSDRLYKGYMQRLESDIDTLVFTRLEERSMELLALSKEVLKVYSAYAMAAAPGTGTWTGRLFNLAAHVALDSAYVGATVAQSKIADRANEADQYMREAILAAALGSVFNARQAGGLISMGAKLPFRSVKHAVAYYRFAKGEVAKKTPELVDQILERLFTTPANAKPFKLLSLSAGVAPTSGRLNPPSLDAPSAGASAVQQQALPKSPPIKPGAPRVASVTGLNIIEHRLRSQQRAGSPASAAGPAPRDNPMQMRRASLETAEQAQAPQAQAGNPPPLPVAASAALTLAEQSRELIERSLPIARNRLNQAVSAISDPRYLDDAKFICKAFYGSDSDVTVQAFKRKQLVMKNDLDKLKIDNIDFLDGEGPGWTAQLQPSTYFNYKQGQTKAQYIEVNNDGAMEYYRDMGNSDDTMANTLIHELGHAFPADEDFVYAGKLRGAREDIVDLLNLGKSSRMEDFRYPSGDLEDGTVSLFAKNPQQHNADSTLFIVALLDQAKNNRPLYEQNIAAISAALDKVGDGLIKETVSVKIVNKREAAKPRMPHFVLARNQHNGDIVAIFERQPPLPNARTRGAGQHVADVVQQVFRWR